MSAKQVNIDQKVARTQLSRNINTETYRGVPTIHTHTRACTQSHFSLALTKEPQQDVTFFSRQYV